MCRCKKTALIRVLGSVIEVMFSCMVLFNVSFFLFQFDISQAVLREHNHRSQVRRPLSVWERLEPRIGSTIPTPSLTEDSSDEEVERFSRFTAERPPPEVLVIPAEVPDEVEDGELVEPSEANVRDPSVRVNARGRVPSGARGSGQARGAAQDPNGGSGGGSPRAGDHHVPAQPQPRRVRVARGGRGRAKFSPLFDRSLKMAEAEKAKRK
ncbi:uncharacterized protein LOC117650631 [Thrips palmi]|uniref:Uncharacterized protein LOC117650631 n=1 Tax=Thrips palmi TaxID=161013 RepID=A0A6P8ZXD9_THRPL|nr:uncharacterized protein LOC117650631 [Thrips palmi]